MDLLCFCVVIENIGINLKKKENYIKNKEYNIKIDSYSLLIKLILDTSDFLLST